MRTRTSKGSETLIPARTTGPQRDWGDSRDLPDDLNRCILELLPAQDIRSVAAVSTSLNRMAEEPLLWKKLVHRDYSNPPKKTPPGGWKTYYREHRSGLDKARDLCKECDAPGLTVGLWRRDGTRVELGEFSFLGSIPSTRAVLAFHGRNGVDFYLPRGGQTVSVTWGPGEFATGRPCDSVGYSTSGGCSQSSVNMEVFEDRRRLGMQQSFAAAFETGLGSYGFVRYRSDGVGRWLKALFKG